MFRGVIQKITLAHFLRHGVDTRYFTDSSRDTSQLLTIIISICKQWRHAIWRKAASVYKAMLE